MNLKHLGLVFTAGLLVSCGRKAEEHLTNSAVETHKQPVLIKTVYRYSVIPGGISSNTDFQQTRMSDPLLQDHYTGVDSRIQEFENKQDRFLYASYKRRGTIWWTAKPVHVAVNETLFQDKYGNLIRGRCGNRLSATPRKPVEFTMPPDLDTPDLDIPISFIETPPALPPEMLPPPGIEVQLPPVSPIITTTSAPGPQPVPIPLPPSRRRWWTVLISIWTRSSGSAPPSYGGGVFLPPPAITGTPGVSGSVPVPVETPEPNMFWIVLPGLAAVFAARRIGGKKC